MVKDLRQWRIEDRVGVGMTGEGESEGEIDRFHVHIFIGRIDAHILYS